MGLPHPAYRSQLVDRISATASAMRVRGPLALPSYHPSASEMRVQRRWASNPLPPPSPPDSPPDSHPHHHPHPNPHPQPNPRPNLNPHPDPIPNPDQVRRWSGQRCAKLVASPPRGLLHLVGRKLNASREQALLHVT